MWKKIRTKVKKTTLGKVLPAHLESATLLLVPRKRSSYTQDPFANASCVEQDGGKIEISPNPRTSVSSSTSSTTPAHQIDSSGCVGQKEASECDWCWVAKGQPEFAGHGLLGREVQLLEVAWEDRRSVEHSQRALLRY